MASLLVKPLVELEKYLLPIFCDCLSMVDLWRLKYSLTFKLNEPNVDHSKKFLKSIKHRVI